MLGGLSKPIAILLLVGGVVWFVAEGYGFFESSAVAE